MRLNHIRYDAQRRLFEANVDVVSDRGFMRIPVKFSAGEKTSFETVSAGLMQKAHQASLRAKSSIRP